MYHCVLRLYFVVSCDVLCSIQISYSALLLELVERFLIWNLCTRICQNASKLNEINWCVNIEIMSELRIIIGRAKSWFLLDECVFIKNSTTDMLAVLNFFFKLAERTIKTVRCCSIKLLIRITALPFSAQYLSPPALSNTLTIRFIRNRSHSTATKLILRYDKRQPVCCK